MSTIGTLVSHGITLGTVTQNGTYASPLTITATGYIDNTGAGDAVFGPNTAPWYVSNAGTITAAQGNGINLQAGGTVVNSGTISGLNYAILSQASARIVNTGVIRSTGTSGFGIVLQAGNSTVTNAGTIFAGAVPGGHQYAVLFNGANSRLIIDPGAVFNEQLKTNAVNTTIELAAGTQSGRTGLFGLKYLGFSQVVVDAGANWTLGVNFGHDLQGVTIDVFGTLACGAPSGDFIVTGGGALELLTGVSPTYGTMLNFSGAGGTFQIDRLAGTLGGMQNQYFNVPINGLVASDRLKIATADLGKYSGIDAAKPGAFNGSTTPLVLTSGGNVVATLSLQGNYAGDAFGVSLPVGGFVTIGMGINAATDFNGDGTGDVLLQNDQNGQLVFAAMANGAFSGWGAATAPLGNLAAVGHGDVNGDGISDVIVQDPNSGQLYFGEQDGSGSGAASWVLGPIVPGFTAVGVGDIQGNDRADIVIQDASGNIDYYDTKAGTLYDAEHGGFVASTPGFNVVGVGDVNGDGYADIVIEDAAGHIDYMNMAGGVASGFAAIATAPGYTVKTVADLTGDGFADIVVQNPSSAADALYADMHGGVFSGWGVATTPLPPDYVVAGAADVFNNGHADLIVQQQSTGNTFYAQEGASGFAGWGAVTTSINSHFHVV